MKSVIASILLITYLLGTTEAGQLFKLPLLISHYAQHKKDSPRITLATFLKIHYLDSQPRDADYAQDMQLPFKTASRLRLIPAVVDVLPKMIFQPLTPRFEQPPLFNVRVIPFQRFINIFHPPRILPAVINC